MVLLHHALIFLSSCQVEEPALANSRAAETRGTSEFFFALCEGAIIETELLSIFYTFLSEHSDGINPCILLDLCDRLAVGVAAVAQAGCEVSKQDWINRENIVAVRVVEMPFVSDVIEIWKIFWQTTFCLALLKNVLLFVPKPLRIDLSKVFNKQAVFANAFFNVAKDAQAFWVDAEVGIVLPFQTLDCFENYSWKFLFHIGKLKGVESVVPDC